MKMNRRDVLKTTGLVLGYTLTAGTAAAILGGCSADSTLDWTPAVLSKEQVTTLGSIAAAIVPGTDKLPGAKDVNIPKFMDERMSMYTTADDQSEFKAGYDAFLAKHKIKGKSADEILTIVRAELDADSKFMKNVYEQSVAGFCTSERGMKEVLIFKPIPGEQSGDVTTEEVGGIWAI
jgi:hypothetical protein